MNKKKIAAIIVAALTINITVPNINAFAAVNNVEYSEVVQSNKATVSKFDIYYSEYKDAYDKEFKLDNSNIKSITSSGGNLRDNVSTANITDGNLDTYWETGKHTSNDFKNELFEGSKYLLIYADKIEEMKTICWFCGKKATMNLRVHNGQPVYEGEQVQIGGNESYYPVCRYHYFHPKIQGKGEK